ncbi:MAG: hypothetical protein Unbinned92contig1002_18 [Prokaryotic dsDNA virus sp.]|nr:MAG: hypothetical protein Unbinned92contig1002_18 [Prokaryotic dsDNA virus sp.]|tara:strand:- start:30100 stop:30249 length:150 start_codon:yes stop_codon:yes gene_type:complete
MKKPKKYTHVQRMAKMEKVLTSLYVAVMSMQTRINKIEEILKIKNGKEQ